MDPDPIFPSSQLQIDITFESSAWSILGFDVRDCIYTAASEVLRTVGYLPIFSSIELSVSMGDDEFLCRLNKEYRNQDKPTNVLSFANGELKPDSDLQPLKGSHLFLGDIAISYDRICHESLEQQKTFHEHLTHILVHAVLHLIGYDHESEADAKIMEDLEISILKNLGISNPYFVPSAQTQK